MERISPGLTSKNTLEHLHRYASVFPLAEGKIIVDVACGEGYGSSLLAKYGKMVIGVDISEATIAAASEKYKQPNLTFKCASALKIPLESNSVDMVISFETIEHLVEHEELINEFKRLLKSDGILVISSPDKKYYADIPGFKNPYHLKELYEGEFYSLLGRHFDHLVPYKQSIAFGSVIAGQGPLNRFEFLTGSFDTIEKSEFPGYPVYHMAIASNRPIENLQNLSGFFHIEGIFEEIIKQKRKLILNSKPYRLGKFILSPFQGIKNLLSRIS